jgi:hypothetical protein
VGRDSEKVRGGLAFELGVRNYKQSHYNSDGALESTSL